ncbi:hypothetical protein [Enterobacter kobei]|uniref:hypothetical protein n=1 Tax=Enterobacter kobei TaxID=208224 RepID=UPI002A7FB388|nr:hypothetical protein [Enterobacter kobei]
MNRHVEVRSIREGVYILWRLGNTEKARQFASGGQRDLIRCNGAINRIIEQALTEKNNNPNIIRRVIRFQEKYKQQRINENIASWVNHDKNACIYFWLYLFTRFTHSSISVEDIRRIIRNGNDRHNYRLYRDALPLQIPDTAEQCFMAGLYILDLLPLQPEEIQHEVDKIRREYYKIKDSLRDDFSWIADADQGSVEWVWGQLKKHRDFLRNTNLTEFSQHLLSQFIPFLYYLWDERRDTKQLFLNTLRKRYANMKHRKKVADKAPVNIRISPGAKNTLVKLEKRFNRNRADVIEYLIEKTWAELNQKN